MDQEDARRNRRPSLPGLFRPGWQSIRPVCEYSVQTSFTNTPPAGPRPRKGPPRYEDIHPAPLVVGVCRKKPPGRGAPLARGPAGCSPTKPNDTHGRGPSSPRRAAQHGPPGFSAAALTAPGAIDTLAGGNARIQAARWPALASLSSGILHMPDRERKSNKSGRKLARSFGRRATLPFLSRWLQQALHLSRMRWLAQFRRPAASAGCGGYPTPSNRAEPMRTSVAPSSTATS